MNLIPNYNFLEIKKGARRGTSIILIISSFSVLSFAAGPGNYAGGEAHCSTDSGLLGNPDVGKSDWCENVNNTRQGPRPGFFDGIADWWSNLWIDPYSRPEPSHEDHAYPTSTGYLSRTGDRPYNTVPMCPESGGCITKRWQDRGPTYGEKPKNWWEFGKK